MRLNLGYQALIALLAGVFAGLFFGPYCEVLKPVGDSFFILLQMVVIPYIPFLLMHGLGSLNSEIAKKIFKRGWFFLVILWGATLAVIYLIIYLIPSSDLAFIENLNERGQGGVSGLIKTALPENFIADLSSNIIPAITIFGLIAGVAIMQLKQKQPLLNLLERANAMIEKILDWIAKISPIAIFAHVSVALGTVRFQDLAKVEFYVFIYIAGALFLTLWILPVILTSLTDFSYKDVLREYNLVCWIPFATAMPTLAFPFMYTALKRLSHRYEIKSSSFHRTGQTVLPLSFTFAQVGNLFILIFIFFLSFYTRHPLVESEKLALPFLTFPLSFGTSYSSVSAASFLINTMHFPDSAFCLFQLTSTMTINFQVLVSVSSILMLTILVITSYYGLLKIKWHYLITHLSLAIGIFSVLVILLKSQIHVEDNFKNLYNNLKMPPNLSANLKVTVNPPEKLGADTNPLDLLRSILEKGVLRVGYSTVDMPFSYLNKEGDLVGYDIAFAHQLAIDLDCSLELILLNYDHLIEELNENKYDIVMSGIVMDEERLRYMDFVQPYLEQNTVVVTPLKNKKAFENLERLQERTDLKVGAVGAYQGVAKRRFPLATFVPMDSIDPFLEGQADVFLWPYLSAFIWSLDHPEYTVLDFNFQLGEKYLSYPVRGKSITWLNFVQNWLTLKKESGFTDQQYNYWIKGEPISQLEPRWSILRNVLHWVD